MSLKINSEEAAAGLRFTEITDEKFNIEAIVIRFITELDEKDSQLYTFVTSLLAESNAKYPDRAQLAARLAGLYGAGLYSIAYRAGDKLVTGLAVNAISDSFTIDKENISDECAELLLDCIFSPDMSGGVFCQRYFDQKKRELIDKINGAADNRHLYAVNRSGRQAFKGEPAAVNLPGTLENAEAITEQTAYEAYNRLLDSAYISVSFIGEGKNVKAKELIKERLLKLCAERGRDRQTIRSFVSPSKCKSEPLKLREEIEQSQSKLIMYFKTDSDEFFAHKLMCAMFGGTPFSKLFSNVREKLSLCYYCQSSYADLKYTMAVDSGVEFGNEEKAEAEIIRQLEAMQNGDFTDEELENTKRYLRSGALANYDTPEGLNTWYFYEHARGTEYSPRQVIEFTERLTREDVIRSARSFKLDTIYELVPQDAQSGGEENA